MIDVTSKICAYDGCSKYPSFNLPTKTKGIYCSDHKQENMIDIKNKNKKCAHGKCNKQSNFNLPTETKGLYCSEHKKENMINVKSKLCIHDGCIKHPTFNFPTETMPIYCSEHKKENMIDIKNRKCIYQGCAKIPVYNLPTETKGIYCFDHKKINMVNVNSNICIYDGCNIQATFNISTEKKGLYCSEHKHQNMVDVNHKACIFENCNKRPTFNLPDETKGIYCIDHKQENMINITNTKCQTDKCKATAKFGRVGKRKQYCENHKKKDMINLDIEYKCNECNNDYEFIINNIKYCLEHCKNKEYEIIIKKKCKYCDIEEKSNYVCGECKKIATKKEWSVVRYIKKNIDTKFNHNMKIQDQNCTNKRPDVYFELDTHCVIVEIDENQHKSYEAICECARINEIVNSIGGKSVVFIRYNPDKTYNTYNGNKKEIQVELIEKLKTLIKIIKTELIKEYDKFCVKLIQLYYDDNCKKYMNIKRENITDKVSI